MAGGETRALPQSVARLSGSGENGFLHPHHIEAAVYLTRLFEKASLRQRVTMSYDPTRIGRTQGHAPADLADTAANARRTLKALAHQLPPDCWGVLADVCVYDKGLQDIELERRWPRRAAKLVLRIGLDQAAALLGLRAHARGRAHTDLRSWLPQRPPMFDVPTN